MEVRDGVRRDHWRAASRSRDGQRASPRTHRCLGRRGGAIRSTAAPAVPCSSSRHYGAAWQQPAQLRWRGLAGRAAIILFFQTACAASSAAPRFCGAAALNCCTMLRLDASHWHCSAVLQSRPCTQSAQLPTSGRHGRSRPVADRSRAQQRMRATTEMRPLAYGPCDAANGDAHSTSRDSSFRKGPFG